MFDPNNMKEYFRNIVTKRLDDAPVGPAKGELIEELAENLTCRYNDLVASGMEAHEAQDRALEALGDTAELVEYLKSLEPDQPLPELVTDPEKTDDGKLDDLLHNVEDLIRGALKKAKTAIGEAKENLKEKGETLELDENENIKNAKALMDGVKTQLPSMFETSTGADGKMRVVGDNRLPEGDQRKPTPTKEQFKQMSYEERVALKQSNEELYRSFSK